jgi:ribonucleoside-diphosphate reductase alpha chain
MKACMNCEADNDACFDPSQNPALKRDQGRQEGQVPENYIKRVLQFARRATPRSSSRPTTPTGIRRPIRRSRARTPTTRSRHRRLPAAVEDDGEWDLTNRKDGKVIAKTRQGARSVGEGRPCRLGLGRSGHPVPHHHERLAHLPGDGEIRASNPCSEYMFLDDTACNLASMNLLPSRTGRQAFDIAESYEHAVRLWTHVLEISVMMAQFPSKEIAQLSYEYRTLGLGYANIGGLLMTMGHSL